MNFRELIAKNDNAIETITIMKSNIFKNFLSHYQTILSLMANAISRALCSTALGSNALCNGQFFAPFWLLADIDINLIGFLLKL